MDGSCWDLNSSSVPFWKYLASSCGWRQSKDPSIFFFSGAFIALMPSRDWNAVRDTIIIAIAPSAWYQNNTHTMSKVFFTAKPETRTMTMMIIQTLKHKNIPKMIFCWHLILNFQIKMSGIKMTMSEVRILVKYLFGGLPSKSNVISKTMLKASARVNSPPSAHFSALG